MAKPVSAMQISVGISGPKVDAKNARVVLSSMSAVYAANGVTECVVSPVSVVGGTAPIEI
jgi:hypothetical protein